MRYTLRLQAASDGTSWVVRQRSAQPKGSLQASASTPSSATAVAQSAPQRKPADIPARSSLSQVRARYSEFHALRAALRAAAGERRLAAAPRAATALRAPFPLKQLVLRNFHCY